MFLSHDPELMALIAKEIQDLKSVASVITPDFSLGNHWELLRARAKDMAQRSGRFEGEIVKAIEDVSITARMSQPIVWSSAVVSLDVDLSISYEDMLNFLTPGDRKVPISDKSTALVAIEKLIADGALGCVSRATTP